VCLSDGLLFRPTALSTYSTAFLYKCIVLLFLQLLFTERCTYSRVEACHTSRFGKEPAVYSVCLGETSASFKMLRLTYAS